MFYLINARTAPEAILCGMFAESSDVYMFGVVIFEDYMSNNVMLLPLSSFFIIGLIIWVIRQYDTKQVEAK